MLSAFLILFAAVCIIALILIMGAKGDVNF